MSGIGLGCYNLAVSNLTGSRGEPDGVSALTFLIIAADIGHDLANRDLDRLADDLTPDQIAQAIARAERCTTSGFADCD